MKTLKKYAPVLFLVFITSACQLISPRPLSQKFYCKINGVGWRPDTPGPISFYYPLRAEWNTKGVFNIYAKFGVQSVDFSLKLKPNEPLEAGIYKLGDVRPGYIGGFSPSQNESLDSKTGNLVITKIEKGMISGTFEFTVYSTVQKKTYKITKGQFNDLRFNTTS